MNRMQFCLALLVLTLGMERFAAADEDKLIVAEGKLNKVDKEVLTMQPREADGKFGKHVELKLTGTTRFSRASTKEASGKQVVVQNELKWQDLRADQTIAVVYLATKDGLVLLSAVIHASDK